MVSPSALRELEEFHVEAARRLAGMCPWKVKGEWVYPHSTDVLAAEYYIQKTPTSSTTPSGAAGRRGAAAPHPDYSGRSRT